MGKDEAYDCKQRIPNEISVLATTMPNDVNDRIWAEAVKKAFELGMIYQEAKTMHGRNVG